MEGDGANLSGGWTSPGDYLLVPPWVPHREENPDPANGAIMVIARTTQEAIIVNLDGLDSTADFPGPTPPWSSNPRSARPAVHGTPCRPGPGAVREPPFGEARPVPSRRRPGRTGPASDGERMVLAMAEPVQVHHQPVDAQGPGAVGGIPGC